MKLIEYRGEVLPEYVPGLPMDQVGYDKKSCPFICKKFNFVY